MDHPATQTTVNWGTQNTEQRKLIEKSRMDNPATQKTVN